MLRILNGWQRLWVVAAGVSFCFVLFLQVTDLPREDPNIIQQVQDVQCGWLWQEIPDFIPVDQPRPGQYCYELARFQSAHTTPIRSVQQYKDQLRADTRWQVCAALLVWLLSVLGVYLLGFSYVWVRKGFRGASHPRGDE